MRSVVTSAAMILALAADPGGAAEIHGFVEGLAGVRAVQGSGFEEGDYTAEESRLQLRISDFSDEGEYFVRLDAFLDHVEQSSTDLELREAFFTHTGWSRADAKIGRQTVTWGTGDLLFINDVFPKDWESFFVGREDQYLKAPLDAVRVGIYGGAGNLTVVLSPRFEPDRLPTPGRLAFYDPLQLPDPPREPDDGIRDGEIAVRLDRAIGNLEASLYGYVGHFRQPVAFDPVMARVFYPSLNVYGASLRGAWLGGVANVEVGYYDSRDDRDGTDATVENSTLRGMWGFDRQVWTDFQIGLQGYYERMRDHDSFRQGLAPGAFERDELVQLYTLRVTQLLDYQTLRLSGFVFASPTEEDYYVRASAGYKLSDPVELVLGTNVFGGSDGRTLFGQLDDNDNIYFRARYSF